MNTTQLIAARAVIESAPLLCAQLIKQDDTERGYVCCAIGELALAAGHTPEDVYDAQGGGDVDSDVIYTAVLPKLVPTFGLSESACERIVEANDSPFQDGSREGMSETSARRAAVLQVLDEIACVDAVGAR